MNKFDVEFWNGVLKGKIEDVQILKGLLDHVDSNQVEAVKICIRSIQDSKALVERVHAKEIQQEIRIITTDV